MDPETNQLTNSEPASVSAPPQQVTLSMDDLRAMMKEAVQEAVLAATAPLLHKNEQLQAEVAQSSGMTYAEGVPQHLRRGDPSVDPNRMSVARSVTLATRPVIENPDQYTHVVDASGLVRNSFSGGFGAPEAEPE